MIDHKTESGIRIFEKTYLQRGMYIDSTEMIFLPLRNLLIDQVVVDSDNLK